MSSIFILYNSRRIRENIKIRLLYILENFIIEYFQLNGVKQYFKEVLFIV